MKSVLKKNVLKNTQIDFFSGTCTSCGISIEGEASVVGEEHYHPKCFVCTDCKKPLGTAKYYIIGGQNYCAECRYVRRRIIR